MKKVLTPILALLAFGLFSSSAFAQAGGSVSPDQAVEVALKEVPGTLYDIDFEYRSFGSSYYEVEIRHQGREYEVYVDAKTAKVLRVNQDD